MFVCESGTRKQNKGIQTRNGYSGKARGAEGFEHTASRRYTNSFINSYCLKFVAWKFLFVVFSVDYEKMLEIYGQYEKEVKEKEEKEDEDLVK